jgi:hypothetical protein
MLMNPMSPIDRAARVIYWSLFRMTKLRSIDVEAEGPDQSRIWSTSISDVPGTLENYISIHNGSNRHVTLLAVAHTVLRQIDQGHKEGRNTLPDCSNKSFHILYQFYRKSSSCYNVKMEN